MNRKYLILSIVILIIAMVVAYSSDAAKHAKDDRINVETDKLIRQTEIDAAKKISAIDMDIQKTEREGGDNTKITNLLKSRSDLESNRIGRVAALHSMPEIIKYNDLEDYLWYIREGFLKQSDFESVGLSVPENWIMHSKNIEMMNDAENRMR